MLNEILFLVLSLIIVVGALKMLNTDELIHAVVYLGLVLGGVAGIYLTLSAEFLAAIQILVYVGAVVTLILFAVMLTTSAEPTEGFAEDRTPLSVLGLEAPHGVDVEAMEEVSEGATSVAEAEAELSEAEAPAPADEPAEEPADEEGSEEAEAPDEASEPSEDEGEAEPEAPTDTEADEAEDETKEER